MPCFHQQLAVPMPGRTVNGKTPYKFIGKASNYYTRYQSVAGLKFMPCKKCIGCRLENSRQWATRILLEKNQHEKACFLTLTYDEEKVPKNGSLSKDHFSKFIDDLRQRMNYYGKEKIKYFGCGEYGEKKGRPHYHLCLFGPFDVHSDDDCRTEEEPTRNGDRQFSHSDIAAVWDHGLHRFSDLTFESAAYTARYVLKKISGDQQAAHYGDRIPEFQRQSNGFGKGHVESWLGDIYPADHVVLPGRGAFLPPPYFDRLLEKVDPSLYARVKKARQEAKGPITTREEFLEHVSESTREGKVRQLVTDATLIRGIDQ